MSIPKIPRPLQTMFLVLTGNEFGISLDVHERTKFIPYLDVAEKLYDQYIEEYGVAVMYKVESDRLIPIKHQTDF